MHRFLAALLVLASTTGADAPRLRALLNVSVVDAKGVTSELVAFHRLSGEDFFRGYLGAAEIEVDYERMREIRVKTPAQPGGRMRATLVLRTGKEVNATFDEREGEQLFSGFAHFGRASVFFRDIRHLRFIRETKRSDLPDFGPPATGVDVRLKDRTGVETELFGFRRLAGENVVQGVRGATAISIPLRILEALILSSPKRTGLLAGTATFRKGKAVNFQLPSYEEKTVYGGEAEFGVFRIRLSKVRELRVHRATPVFRELPPIPEPKKPEGARAR